MKTISGPPRSSRGLNNRSGCGALPHTRGQAGSCWPRDRPSRRRASLRRCGVIGHEVAIVVFGCEVHLSIRLQRKALAAAPCRARSSRHRYRRAVRDHPPTPPHHHAVNAAHHRGRAPQWGLRRPRSAISSSVKESEIGLLAYSDGADIAAAEAAAEPSVPSAAHPGG